VTLFLDGGHLGWKEMEGMQGGMGADAVMRREEKKKKKKEGKEGGGADFL